MRTKHLLSALVAQLASNCGDMFEACKACGVSLMFVQQWRKDDADVDAALAEAAAVGALQIESVALQRALRGHEEDVYYQGDVVGSKIVHHDGLLQAIMKAKLPEYGKDAEGARQTFNGPTQINIMPRAENYQQWLQMKDATMRHALPAPERGDEVLEGEFVSIPDASPLAGLGI